MTGTVDPDEMDSCRCSLSRYTKAEEIAGAVALLADPRSPFLNGQVIRVGGGFTIFPA